MKHQFLFILVAMTISHLAICQDTNQYVTRTLKIVLIETNDGTSISGTVLSENAETIVLETKSFGTVTIQKSNIKSIKKLDDTSFVNGSYRFENPSASYYLLSPSSFSLKRGAVNYQNYYIVGQCITVGITNQLSVSAGTELLTPLIQRKLPRLYFVAARTNYRIAENFGVGIGILYLGHTRSGIIEASTQYGLAYGQATFGKKNHNATIGVGWGFRNMHSVQTDTDETYTQKGLIDRPLFSFSGMTRVAKRIVLTTETWFYPKMDFYTNWYTLPTKGSYSYTGMATYGVRFIGEKMSFDLGFLNDAEIVKDIWIGVPYITFAVQFGGERKKTNE